MAAFTKGDKLNYKVNAKILWEEPKSVLFECEGDKVWVAKSIHHFEDGVLEIPAWFFDKHFK